jgi:hypothetical protein
MRRILLLLAIVIVNQYGYSQTTMTEYNYLTKGYQLDLETGRDIKNGYELLMATPNTESKVNGVARTISVSKFILIEENRTVALLIKISRKDTNYVKYLCLPDWDSTKDVKDKAKLDFFKQYEYAKEKELAAAHYLWLSLNTIKIAYLK